MESTTIYEDNNILFNLKNDINIQKIHSCENLAGLFIKSLPRRTFEQMIHKFRHHHLNDVSLHEGRNRIYDEQYCIKEYRMLYSFFSTRFLSQRVFLENF